MVAEESLQQRRAIGIIYICINIAVFAAYYRSDSLISHYIHNQEYLAVITVHVVHITSIILYFAVSSSDPGFVSLLPSTPSTSSTPPIPSSAIHPADRDSFCEHCQFVRPLHSKHCRICNRCVIQFDHHCGWIANCVGYNNRKLYISYLLTQFSIAAFALYLSMHSLHISVFRDSPSQSNPPSETLWFLFEYTPLYLFLYAYRVMLQFIYQALIGGDTAIEFAWSSVSSGVLFVGMLIAVIFSSMLSVWSVYLMLTNQTTYSFYVERKRPEAQRTVDEIGRRYIDKQRKEKVNKTKSWVQKIMHVFCFDELDERFVKPRRPQYVQCMWSDTN